MERPKTATATSHYPIDLSKLDTSPYRTGRVTNPRPKEAPGSSHHLRGSLFTAFGLCTNNSEYIGDRHTNLTSLEQARSPENIATASGTRASGLSKWSRRPSMKLATRVGRAVVGDRKKEGIFASKQNNTDETSTTRSPRSAGWLQSLTRRRGKQRQAITLDTISTDLPGHVDSTSNAPNFYEDDYAWDVGHGGGAAARAAAAAQNELLELSRHLSSKEWHQLRDLKLTSDSESGIGIEFRDQPDELGVTIALPVRRDPATALPEELFAHILHYLDAQSLLRTDLVSLRWHASANASHLWRDIFTCEYGRAPPLQSGFPSGQVGGLGFGLHKPDQHWKRMWKARKALQARWAQGHAAAIYLEGHQDTVYCVQFDEHKILTGSRDRTIRMWDARTFECLRVLGVPKQTNSAQMSTPLPPPLPNRPTKGHQPFDVLTPLTSGRSLRRPPAEDATIFHEGSVLCLQFDTHIMVTGSSDRTLIMWDVKANWKPMRRLRQHEAGVLDVCFNTQFIVSCSKDTTICLWDRSNGSLLRILAGHRGPVNAVQLRGELIVSASGDGVAKLWNISSGLCVKEFPSRDRGLACVEFSPDCRMIFAGGNDHAIYQFDATNGELVRELKGHSHLVRSLHLDSINGRIVSGSYDRSIKVYDVEQGKMICDFAGWTTSWMLSAKADYRRVVAASQDRRVVIMDFGYGLSDIDLLRGSVYEED